MKINYEAEDGSIFTSEEECINYEESMVPVFYAVDIYRTGGTKHHHESLLGVYFSANEAEEKIAHTNSTRKEDLNQRYEIRRTKMFKEVYNEK